MKSAFATTWKSSVQRRKQRKYQQNAPAHIKGKFLAAHLSKELKEKHDTRSVRVKVGDQVKIIRGSMKGKEGRVENVDVTNTLIYIEKVDKTKHDGSKTRMGIAPSNVVITELDLSDKKRKAKLTSSTQKEETRVQSTDNSAKKAEKKGAE